MDKVTVVSLQQMKRQGEKIASLTAYDYSFARLLDVAGVDLILVGDSLGMVVQGHESTIPVSLEEMIYHTALVARGAQRALVVADMPFMSYQRNPEQALDSAGRLMKEGSAQMVKLEGGAVMVETVRCLVERGIPVCGHLGLTPQSVHQLGDYRVQGRETQAAEQLMVDAQAVAEAGASLLVLEAVPRDLGAKVTESVDIPTIGIGAGPGCDGQVLVLYDMLGLSGEPAPRFVKDFLQGANGISGAVSNFVAAVKNVTYPAAEHCYD